MVEGELQENRKRARRIGNKKLVFMGFRSGWQRYVSDLYRQEMVYNLLIRNFIKNRFIQLRIGVKTAAKWSQHDENILIRSLIKTFLYNCG
jgi:hypothetical protein